MPNKDPEEGAHNKLYKPIDCNYYDVLVLNAMHKNPVSFRVKSEDDLNIIELKGIIKDIYTKDKVEYLRLDSGKVVRLDKLLDINTLK